MSETPPSNRNALVEGSPTADIAGMPLEEAVGLLMRQLAETREEADHLRAEKESATNTEARRPPPTFPNLDLPIPDHFAQTQTGVAFQTPLRQNTTHVGSSSHQTPAFQTPAHATNTNTYQAPRATGVPVPHLVQPNVTFQDHVTHIDSSPELENMEMFFEARIDKMEKERGKKIAELEHSSKKKDGLRYSDLCIHPDLGLPEGFKIPKFDHFNRSDNPKAHLRAYCDQLVGNGENEALLMRKKWQVHSWKDYGFNVENVPDRFSLEKIRQKSETYREYASHWRDEAARVQPPMTKAEVVAAFIRYQKSDCFDKMITMKGRTFADLVAIGEDIKDGLKTDRIVSVLNRSGASGAMGGKKKREDIAYVSRATSPKSQGKEMSHKNSENYQSPPPTNYITTSIQYSLMFMCYAQPGYQAPQPNCQTPTPSNRAPLPNYRMPAPNNQSLQNQTFQNQPSLVNYEAPQRKLMRAFTPMPESRTSLFSKLRDTGRISAVPPKPANPTDRWYRPDLTCAYHSNQVGHATEYYINLRHKLQDMID
ncbi:uncharacterized protein LOC132054303 [Lycium ferocissimum]|uniref:uncharacterized protein LOC132054303 n=1 Tax=Lycium ferocissimum TaxID=112874 RepID=UPI00281576BC|nr:uncharacterized protein LOC132054303 [Lycium ferocissimum]